MDMCFGMYGSCPNKSQWLEDWIIQILKLLCVIYGIHVFNCL